MDFIPKSKNLRHFTLIHFFLECQFWFPVWLIFLTQKGFDLAIIVLADGIFRFSVVAFEFPMGLLSDRIGRKKTYILIGSLAILTYMGIVFIKGTIMLFAVWILWGILWALYSGIPSAYIYELVVVEKLEQHTVKVFGFFKMISSSASLISYLLAGILLSIFPSLPFIINAVFALLALLIIFLLPDTNKGKNIKFESATKTFKQFFRLFRENSNVLISVLLLALALVYYWSPRILMQPLFLELKISPVLVSVVYFSYSLSGIVAGLFVNKIRHWIGVKYSIITGFFVIWCGIMFIALIPGYSALWFFPMLSFGFIICQTLLEAILHSELENRFRASMLSAVSFLGGIVIIFTRPGLGLLANRFNTPTSFLIWGLIGIYMFVFFWILVYRLPSKITNFKSSIRY